MTKFISEESDLLREEKQIIWEMFVDWFPYYKSNINENLSLVNLQDGEKEVFELVFLLGFVMSIFDSLKLLRQKKRLESEIEIKDIPSLMQVILNHNLGYNFTEIKTQKIIPFFFASTHLGEKEIMDIFRAGAIHFTGWSRLKADKEFKVSLGIKDLLNEKDWLLKVKPILRASMFLISEIK